MIQKCFLVLLVCLLSHGVFATSLCHSETFLKGGFNIGNYEKCVALFNGKHCLTGDILPDVACVEKIAKREPVCRQFYQLSKQINAELAATFAKAVPPFTVIDQTFIADGQSNYYLISPRGCLIDTGIDPKQLNPTLKKQYEKIDFFMVSAREPSLQRSEKGYVFRFPLEARDTCLACPTVGTAILDFKFNQSGDFQEVSLASFDKARDEVGPSCPDLSVTNIHSRTALTLFLSNLQMAVENQDKEAIARLIHYPLRVNGMPQLKMIKSQSEFEKHFPVLFSKKIKQAILSQQYQNLFCRDQGVMIGDGEVWINERDGKIGIFSINEK